MPFSIFSYLILRNVTIIICMRLFKNASIHRCRLIFIRLVSPKNQNSLFIRHIVSFSNSLCGEQFNHYYYYYYYYFQCGSATKCRVRFKIINLIIFELLIHRWKRVRNRSMGLHEHCITYASTCWFVCDPSLASFAQSNVSDRCADILNVKPLLKQSCKK